MVSIPILSNTSLSTADLESEGSVAKVKSALLKEWLRTVRSEERSKLLKRLLVEGLGTNDVEDFMAGQDDLKFNIGDIGSLDQIDDFWGQKSSHFDDFWGQK